MSIRRRALLPLIGAGILVVIATLHAQFPKVHIPKPPSVPGVKTATPAEPAPPPVKRAFCSGITNEQIDQFIKAKQVQVQVLQSELAKANAMKDRSDAMDKKLAAENADFLMKNGECTDAAKEKDPRSKEIARLEALAETATNANDEAKAQQYQRKSSRISEALEIDADRACGGRGISRLFDCRAKKMAADDRSADLNRLRRLADDAGKKGDQKKQADDTEQADSIEDQMKAMAQMACMTEHPELAMAGGRDRNAEEQAAHDATEAAFRNTQANADKAAQDAGKLTEDEFSRLDHCVRNVLGNNPATPIDDATKTLIQSRSGDLKPFIK